MQLTNLVKGRDRGEGRDRDPGQVFYLVFPTCQNIKSENSYQPFSTELRVLSEDSYQPSAFSSQLVEEEENTINRRFTPIIADQQTAKR